MRPFNIFVTTFLGLLFYSYGFGQAKAINTSKELDKKSKVTYFNYGGYGDSTLALIVGYIFEPVDLIAKDSLRPLKNVTIQVIQNNKTVYSNSKGQFAIGLEKGSFNLLISKPGYQPLLLTNYYSNPDQISDIKIVLVKGGQKQLFRIINWTK